MYIVELINDRNKIQIHGSKEKLKSGSVVKGINAIDSFSFAILPSNKGFSNLYDFKTLVTVYNTNKKRYEFHGRVLYSNTSMDESGLITKESVCESYLGFLCDSVQLYVEEKNWTVNELFKHIINVHNQQVEEYKKFVVGEVDVTDKNDNLYVGIQRENSWKTIEEKLINVLGGEIQLRVEDGVNYIDYLTEVGTTRSTEIKLSKNMKAITKESDPSSCITRLIPLGCKLTKEVTNTDENGETKTETVVSEERLDISSVNNGCIYIDDEVGIEMYGIHVGYVEFDDVTVASNLLRKGQEWLAESNKVQVKYSVTALDLSLLGLDMDDFSAGDRHPIINPLIGVNDVARISKKTINVCNEVESAIEIGDSFKTFSDIQHDQIASIGQALQSIQVIGTTTTKLAGKISDTEKKLENNYSTIVEIDSSITQKINEIETNVSMTYETKQDATTKKTTLESSIKQNADNIALKVSKNGIISAINQSAESITIKANKISLEGIVTANNYFKVLEDGSIEATNATINGKFISHSNNRTCYINNGQIVLFPEKVADPSTYEGDDVAVISYNNLFINGSGYFNSLDVGGAITAGSNVISQKNTAADAAVIAKNSVAEIRLLSYQDGKRGLWDATQGNWMLYRPSGGNAAYMSGGTLYVGDKVMITSGTDSGNIYIFSNSNYRYEFDTSSDTLRLNLFNSSGTYLGTPLQVTTARAMQFNNRCTVPPEGDAGIRPYSDKGYACGHSSYRWSAVYGASSAINTSDRNQKKDFRTFDSNENYEELFLDLKPTVYKFKDGTSNRDHFGFISQDVEESLYKFGFNDKSFGGFCKDVRVDEDEQPVLDEDGNEQFIYSLRYEEFISLNTYMIQKLYKRIEELEGKIL